MSSARLGLSLVAISVVSAVAVWGCAEEAGSALQQCVPGMEVCNGIDDDCDKFIDENEVDMEMTRDCSNGCGEGFQVCRDGDWIPCDAPEPKEEVCNGVDDDCDGYADNGFECAKGETRKCGSDVGECKEGTQECESTCEFGDCKGDVEPQDEECEGSDDEDCDGTVDNGCGCAAGETKDCCGGITITCQGGKWPSCPTPPAESCNGADEDCSGVADDNLPDEPFMADESSSGADSCAQAYTAAFIAPLMENGSKEDYSFYLYKAHATVDRDFFSFPTSEETSPCDLSEYECYMISVRLTQEPAGKDYELCLYDMGGSSAGASCDGKPKTCSKADGNPANEVMYMYEGGCGDDDNNRFVVEVFGASDADQSCEPYKIEMELIGSGPQPTDCGL